MLERALSKFWLRPGTLRLQVLILFATALVLPAAWSQDAPNRVYQVNYSGTFKPSEGIFAARIEVRQETHLLRVLDFAAPESHYRDFSGDGEIRRDGDRLLWSVPETGGSLQYDVVVDHKRGETLDASLTSRWSIVRLDDLFPPASVRTRKRSQSHATLDFKGPKGWLYETPYGPIEGQEAIVNDGRRFDRPIGWLAAGKLGIRREIIADRKVAVAAPIDQGLRRVDILAFLGWVLPDLVEVFPEFPERLMVTGAREGMWRGALSGPKSLYVHSDRPLLSENGTSTLLHELVHIACGLNRGEREDWIIEGLAEYYSLEILRRSGGVTRQRFEASMDELEAWAKSGKGALRSPSTGADTARAVIVFRDVQTELREKKAGKLDSIVRELVAGEDLTGARLLALVETKLDGPSKTLRAYLPTGEEQDGRGNE